MTKVWVEEQIQMQQFLTDQETELTTDPGYVKYRKERMAMELGMAIVERFGEWHVSRRAILSGGTSIHLEVNLMYRKTIDA